MNSVDTSLPKGFESLEPFVAQWAANSAAQRAQCRLLSTESERQAFFHAVQDQVNKALEQLDKKNLADLNTREQRLMNLLLSFAHVALAEEIQRDDESKQAQLRQYLNISQASADRQPWITT